MATQKLAPPAATPSADTAPVPLTFHGREMLVHKPETEQVALLIEANQWFKRFSGDHPELKNIPPNAPAAHPGVIAAAKRVERGLVHVGRLQIILGSLFANPDDWDWIQDLMAEKRIPWADVAALPGDILAAHNAADEMTPDNRAAKRATKRASRTA